MASIATETCRSAAALLPSSSPSSRNHYVTDNHRMHESLHLNRRKRNHPEQHSGQPSEESLPAKRRRVSNPREPQAPPAFWDNLSKLWLTKRALRELNRRNVQTARSPSFSLGHHAHRSFTRADDFLKTCTTRTLKDVKSFARQGGPDLSELRNFPDPTRLSIMSSGRSSDRSQQRDSTTPASTGPTTNTTRTKSTGVYDRDFQQHLVDHAIYPHGYRRSDGSVPAKPTNWKDVYQILRRSRPSVSPSRFTDEDHERFVQADADASKEKQVSELVLPFLEGKITDARCRSGGIPFGNLDPLTDGTLKPGNPDIYYGARPEQLSRTVRQELDGQITPSTQHDLPMVPNFFLAAKGPDGSLAVAGRQACYDGAFGARGMHSLQSYRQAEPVYDNNAYTMTSIYHGGQLKMFTTHVGPPRTPGGRPEYHTTQLRSFAMTDTADTFRQGAAAYRNARDWAKEQRDDAIKKANDRAIPVDVEASNQDADASPALSFVTAVTETEAYTMSQESHTSLNEGTNVLGIFEESDSSVEDLTDSVPAKRFNKQLEHSQRPLQYESSNSKRKRTE